MAALPYKLYGGATRADAISGLDQAFSQALLRMYQEAPPEVQRELGLNSAYRSPAVQQALWNASDKSGKMVAAPGKSKHQHGTAADLYGFGLGGKGGVSEATKQWVHQNAGRYNLNFPMSYEPWHIQLAGEGSGGSSGAAPAGSQVSGSPSGISPMMAAALISQNSPKLDFTDVASRRGGPSGERSAGARLVADASPSIPPLETASATVPPALAPPAAVPTAAAPTALPATPNLASMFKVKPVGGAAAAQAQATRGPGSWRRRTA